MSRNEDFNNGFWDEPDIEDLSANATLLYVWSWTNKRCGMAGMYKVSHRGMTQSKVALEDVPDALAELADGRFAFYEDSVLWVRSRVKRLRTKSSQMAKSVARDVAELPVEHPLRQRFLAEYGDASWLRDALSGVSNPRLIRGSGEPHQNVDSIGVSVNLTRTSPEVPLTGQRTGSLSGTNQQTTKEKVDLPRDFPDELKPHLAAAYRVLRDLAERHNAKALSPLGLANVVMARPHKPIVRAAHDCAAYWDDRNQPLRDVVAAYRNWLDKADDLAGIELVDGKGIPTVRQPLKAVNGAGRDSSKYNRAAGLA